MSKIPVSVCIIAKNEEKYIEQCLRHLIKYGVEIIVADTGSTDQTKEIAAKYTKNVYDFEWIDDFSAARNFAASKASNNWILAIDCDEYIKDIDISKLRIMMQKYNKLIGTIELRNIFTDEDNTLKYQTDKVLRFYNKNFYHFKYRIHEQIVPKDEKDLDTLVLNTFILPMTVEHHGYNISKEDMLKKQERNLYFLNKAIGENPYNDDYLYFQIGQSYEAIDDKDRAISAYKKCYELNTNDTKDFIALGMEKYFELLYEKEDFVTLVNHSVKFRKYINTSKLNYFFATALEKCGAVMDALLLYTQIILKSDFDMLGDKAYEVYSKIILLCKMTDNNDKVEMFKKKMQEYAKEHGKILTYNE